MIHSLKDRLENWGRFQRGGNRVGGGGMRAKETRSASPYGGQGYKCMTGVICNILASSATGPAGWRRGVPMTSEEIADAKLVTLAFITLKERSKAILRWCYVQNAQPAVICRKMGISPWPASNFKRELEAAESEIALVLDRIEKGNRIPRNNLFPSDETSEGPAGGLAVPGGNEEEAPD